MGLQFSSIALMSLTMVRIMKLTSIQITRPDEEPILAGRLGGKRMFLKALEEMPSLSEPTVVILDFAGVDLATSSFLSELLIPLRDHLRFRRPPGYVVVANANDRVIEEMDELLSRIGDALLACKSANDKISRIELVGKLDPKLLETLELVRRQGETSAVELHSYSTDSDSIGPTAWNNRLAALARKSLVIEIPQGRLKKYRPILEYA
jgi:hypothetical protein